MPSSPEALIRLLLNARDGEYGAVWSLQNELPFLWLALPLSAWETVLRNDYDAVRRALAGIGADKAAGYALARLNGLCDKLTVLEPALETVFSRAVCSFLGLPAGRSTPLPSLRDLVNSFVIGEHHRGNDTPNDLATRLGLRLPPEIAAVAHADFAGLFAPVLLAASARGELSIESDLALLVRRTLREDPVYVSAAWCRLLDFRFRVT
jgi:hypothetical protein